MSLTPLRSSLAILRPNNRDFRVRKSYDRRPRAYESFKPSQAPLRQASTTTNVNNILHSNAARIELVRNLANIKRIYAHWVMWSEERRKQFDTDIVEQRVQWQTEQPMRTECIGALVYYAELSVVTLRGVEVL
jgi:hypothetical protein